LQLVIADTGPINYLILIGHIDILPALFGKIILPAAVRSELTDAPHIVRIWIADPPPWLEVRAATQPGDTQAEKLDPGEKEAIALALEIHADLLLMDDREGVTAARSKGLTVTGTLGVLALAGPGQYGILNLSEAIARIKQTNFRYSQKILDALLADVS
jgi:predicted nucleic acid-binding protein